MSGATWLIVTAVLALGIAYEYAYRKGLVDSNLRRIDKTTKEGELYDEERISREH